MNNIYQVAGFCFKISGDRLCKVVECFAGFKPFLANEGKVLFSFVEGTNAPEIRQVQYKFIYEDVTGIFGCSEHGFILSLKPSNEEALNLWHYNGETVVRINGNLSSRLYRFALWIGVGIMLLPYNTVAVHSSCIVYNGKAVLFLGESGTGKSTHTQLWQKYIPETSLLNDDSPIIRIENGKVWAYGSPWSGKTPCYKSERYELAGCVRLSQAPYNKIDKLSVLQAYGAIHPSCPPEFAYDQKLYDCVSGFINNLLCYIPFYHLACLPNREAALLSFKSIFNNEEDTQ